MENIIIDVCKVFGLAQDSVNLDYIHQELTAFWQTKVISIQIYQKAGDGERQYWSAEHTEG